MIDLKSKPMMIALVAALAIAAFVGFGPAGYALLKGLLVLCAFALGLAAARSTSEPPSDLDAYLESDWRHFEMLVELTPEQIAKLQSLTRRTDLKAEALAWLEGQWTLKAGTAEALLKFFVKSGWASGGNATHANDPDWRWEI